MDKIYRNWKVDIKEMHSDKVLHTDLKGCYNINDVIEFFGLNEPDIEWYTITEYKYKFNNKDNGR